jgi:DNA-binding CsgD family transcriptional regulator
MNYNDYLLQLYRGTSDVPVDEFPEFAFTLTNKVLWFDSARMMAVEVGAGSATVHCSVTHNEPDTLHLDWETISSQDTVLKSSISRPNQSFNYNAQHLFADREHAIVRDYAIRYNHFNGLVVAAPNPATGYWDGLSLFRARDACQFTKADEVLIDTLAPHLRQALALSRSRGIGTSDQDCAMAVVTPNGDLEYCTPQFVRLVNLEFPSWRGHRLPSAVLAALSRVGIMSFSGTKVKLKVRRHQRLLFVYALLDDAVLKLSERELMVARLFSQGRSHKEVAQIMHIAPATARNFIQKIYAKLDVRDKAALAQLIAHI